MSHCDNCFRLDNLLGARKHQVKALNAAEVLKTLFMKWSLGEGFLRFFFSVEERCAMWEGTYLFIARAEKRIAELDADIEKAQKATVEGEVKHAANKMATDLEKALLKPQDTVAEVRGLADMLDADLRFEDKVADLKLSDLPSAQSNMLKKPCNCGAGEGQYQIHHEWCASLPNPRPRPEQAHAHQGTHYVGDDCKPKHTIKGIAELKAEEEAVSSVPVERAELISLYGQLPTDELKTHLEAALDASVARGISLSPGAVQKKTPTPFSFAAFNAAKNQKGHRFGLISELSVSCDNCGLTVSVVYLLSGAMPRCSSKKKSSPKVKR